MSQIGVPISTQDGGNDFNFDLDVLDLGNSVSLECATYLSDNYVTPKKEDMPLDLSTPPLPIISPQSHKSNWAKKNLFHIIDPDENNGEGQVSIESDDLDGGPDGRSDACPSGDGDEVARNQNIPPGHHEVQGDDWVPGNQTLAVDEPDDGAGFYVPDIICGSCMGNRDSQDSNVEFRFPSILKYAQHLQDYHKVK